jgi:hypothetical protein
MDFLVVGHEAKPELRPEEQDLSPWFKALGERSRLYITNRDRQQVSNRYWSIRSRLRALRKKADLLDGQSGNSAPYR